jgi:hypothetical protein
VAARCLTRLPSLVSSRSSFVRMSRAGQLRASQQELLERTTDQALGVEHGVRVPGSTGVVGGAARFDPGFGWGAAPLYAIDQVTHHQRAAVRRAPSSSAANAWLAATASRAALRAVARDRLGRP